MRAALCAVAWLAFGTLPAGAIPSKVEPAIGVPEESFSVDVKEGQILFIGRWEDITVDDVCRSFETFYRQIDPNVTDLSVPSEALLQFTEKALGPWHGFAKPVLTHTLEFCY